MKKKNKLKTGSNLLSPYIVKTIFIRVLRPQVSGFDMEYFLANKITLPFYGPHNGIDLIRLLWQVLRFCFAFPVYQGWNLIKPIKCIIFGRRIMFHSCALRQIGNLAAGDEMRECQDLRTLEELQCESIMVCNRNKMYISNDFKRYNPQTNCNMIEHSEKLRLFDIDNVSVLLLHQTCSCCKCNIVEMYFFRHRYT